jgi:hypothetical protein
MDWGAVSAVAGVFGTLFVALSVVYLALQVKAGAKATRSQTYYLATAALAEMAALIGSNAELSRIVRIGWNTPDDLTEDEFTQYSYVMLSFLRRYENVYFQWQSGLVDDDFWIGHRENLLWALSTPRHAARVEGPKERLQHRLSEVPGWFGHHCGPDARNPAHLKCHGIGWIRRPMGNWG